MPPINRKIKHEQTDWEYLSTKSDNPFRDFYNDLDKHVKKLGWKNVFFCILRYQRVKHKETGYNFNQVKL